MLIFEYKGIKVTATAEMVSHEYSDVKKGKQTHREKVFDVAVNFWRYDFCSDNFQELIFVKAALQYYMSCYWKRTSKEGSKIDFTKTLTREVQLYGKQSLSFSARQQNKKHSLLISFESGGRIINEVYLEGHDVIMLDMAIGKIVNWLSPRVSV